VTLERLANRLRWLSGAKPSSSARGLAGIPLRWQRASRNERIEPGGIRDPNDLAACEALEKRVIGGPRPLSGPVELREYDPCWAKRYAEHASRVRVALGERVVRIEHVGSTSVPGLVAKPIIDIVLEVPDSANEAVHVGDLEAAGYALRIREPDWFEHRLFKTAGQDVNLHVFSAACSETERIVRFRDWLRATSPTASCMSAPNAS
jgi:GrpB-like predicted nucleotidyltransferase (UPF0157 family)